VSVRRLLGGVGSPSALGGAISFPVDVVEGAGRHRVSLSVNISSGSLQVEIQRKVSKNNNNVILKHQTIPKSNGYPSAVHCVGEDNDRVDHDRRLNIDIDININISKCFSQLNPSARNPSIPQEDSGLTQEEKALQTCFEEELFVDDRAVDAKQQQIMKK
jgi:hypothetical protein